MGLLSGFFDSRFYQIGMRAADRSRDDGKFELAAALYGRLAKRFPDDAGLLVLQGNMRKDTGNYADARRSYQAALDRNPSHADAYLQLGHLAKIQGDIEQAVLSYRRSASLDPSRSDADVELRALEPLIVNSLALNSFDPDNIVLLCAGSVRLVFERMTVAFARRPS